MSRSLHAIPDLVGPRAGLISPETAIEASPASDGPGIGFMKTVAKSGLFDLKTRDRDGVFPNELFMKEASKAAVAGRDRSRK